MKVYLIALLTTLTGCSGAIVNRETMITAEKFTPGGRAQILPNQDEPGSRMTLESNTDLFKYSYWDNRIWGMTNESKFAAVGWEYNLGVRLSSQINVFYRHHSQHMLDEKFGPNKGFPVEDSLGVTIYLYRRDCGPASILH